MNLRRNSKTWVATCVCCSYTKVVRTEEGRVISASARRKRTGYREPQVWFCTDCIWW